MTDQRKDFDLTPSRGLESTLVRVHERNIQRYKRLLRTELTRLERDFITRRLAEERLEIARLTSRSGAAAWRATGATPRSLAASSAAAVANGSDCRACSAL